MTAQSSRQGEEVLAGMHAQRCRAACLKMRETGPRDPRCPGHKRRSRAWQALAGSRRGMASATKTSAPRSRRNSTRCGSSRTGSRPRKRPYRVAASKGSATTRSAASSETMRFSCANPAFLPDDLGRVMRQDLDAPFPASCQPAPAPRRSAPLPRRHRAAGWPG